MAQIDELIGVMLARRADALILDSDRPAQLNFQGTLANGAIVPSELLREMLREIVPLGQKFHLTKDGHFEFPYACHSGTMNVQVERQGAHLSIIIVPQHSLFVPPPASSQVIWPALSHHSAPLYIAPPTTVAPASQSKSAPDLSRLGSVVANSTHAYSAQKPTVGVVPLIGAIIVFCLMLRLITAVLGAHAPALFFLSAIAILIDAQRLGVRRGLVDGWANLEPWQWFMLSFFFGFAGIPAYLVARPVYKSVLPPTRVPPP